MSRDYEKYEDRIELAHGRNEILLDFCLTVYKALSQTVMSVSTAFPLGWCDG